MDVVSALYGALQQESSRLATQTPYLMGGCKLAAAACEFMERLQQCNAVHYVMDLVRPIFSVWDLLRYSNNMGLISTLLRAEHDMPVMSDLVRSINLVLEWAKVDGLYGSDMQDKLQEGCRHFLDNYQGVTDEQHMLIANLHNACTNSVWDDENRAMSQDRITEAVNDLMQSMKYPDEVAFTDIWAEVAQIENASAAEQTRRRNRTLVRMDKHLMLLRSSNSVNLTAAAAVANVDRMSSSALSSRPSAGGGSQELPLMGPGSLALTSPTRVPPLGGRHHWDIAAPRPSSSELPPVGPSSNTSAKGSSMDLPERQGPDGDVHSHSCPLESGQQESDTSSGTGPSRRMLTRQGNAPVPLADSVRTGSGGMESKIASLVAEEDGIYDDLKSADQNQKASASASDLSSRSEMVSAEKKSHQPKEPETDTSSSPVGAGVDVGTSSVTQAQGAEEAQKETSPPGLRPVEEAEQLHLAKEQGDDEAKNTTSSADTLPSDNVSPFRTICEGGRAAPHASHPGLFNPFLEYSRSFQRRHSAANDDLDASSAGEARPVTVHVLSHTSSSLPPAGTARTMSRTLSLSRSSSFSRASTLSRSLSRTMSSQSRTLVRAISDNRGLSVASHLDLNITADGQLVTQSDKFLSKLEQPLDDFLCPLSKEVMRDPVMLETGHTYDRSAIEAWFHEGNRICPATQRLLRRMDLTPNWALKKIIEAWSQQQPAKPTQPISIPPGPYAGFSVGYHSQLQLWKSYSRQLTSSLPSGDMIFQRNRSEQLTSNSLTPHLLEAAHKADRSALKELLKQDTLLDSSDADGFTALHKASAAGHVHIVEQLIAAGATVGVRALNGATPLLMASENGRLEVVECLLSRGASMYAYDVNHQTPLHAAAENGHTAVVEALIRRGAPTESRNETGATPLLLAARRGHVAVVEALLAASAMINAMDKAGYPPLYYAVFEGHTQAAERLLAAGSAVNKPIGTNRNCLLLAPAIKGDAEMVKLLLRYGAKAYANLASLTPLYCAASNGHEDTVAALLDAPGGHEWVDVCETRSHMKLSPLLASIKGGHNDVAFLLLKAGANMEYRLGGEQYGQTALMFAAASGNAQAVKLLLKAGSSTVAVDKDKRDAMLLAIEVGHLRVLEVMLDAGVDPGVMPHRVMSPLEMACLAGSVVAAERLLDAGADVNSISATGSRPVQAACQQGHVDLVKWLVDHGAKTDLVDDHGYVALHDAVHSNSAAMVQLLLDLGADINSFTSEGETPLMIAASQPEGAEMVSFLLQAGATVDLAALGDKHQAVHAAAMENCTAVLDLLLRQGADPLARDSEGSTPLHFAASWGHMEAVQLLLSRGAKVDVEDDRHWTALDLALDKGHDEVAILLVDRGTNVRRKGWCSLNFAVRLNRLQVVELILARDPSHISSVTSVRPGALHLTAENELPEMAELLIKHGADKEALDDKGFTPLLVAAKAGSSQVARVLLSTGANPQALDPEGNSALHLAAASPSTGLSLANALLTANPDLAAKANQEELLPLHVAAARGRADLIRVMLKFAAVREHLDALAPKDDKMMSPLTIACYFGCEAAARTLLSAHADVGGAGGVLPMVVAVSQGHTAVVQLLQRNMKLTKSYISRQQQLSTPGSPDDVDDVEGGVMMASDSKILSAIDEELERELG